MDYEIPELREEIYEINEPKKYGYKRRIFLCELCHSMIETNKYICSVLPRYNIKSYYHRDCYIKYLQMDMD